MPRETLSISYVVYELLDIVDALHSVLDNMTTAPQHPLERMVLESLEGTIRRLREDTNKRGISV